MAEFVYIQNYTRNGNMGISHLVFNQIAAIATNEIKGANVLQKEKDPFKLHKPITCDIRNGLVTVKIYVTLSKKSDEERLVVEIKENVAQALAMLTEMIPFKIDVIVAGFTDEEKGE
ncbi:MAG: hypothetical protein ACOX28_00785 [Bacilli bacterium]|jgi:uncharacterized alkaline shock family protein YloU